MSQPFIEPELLQRMRALELQAREVAEGVLLGIHHARHRGRSIEFAEHKEYSPGDDLRRIDWKVYGKSDRLYVKEYEDETNITAAILVDSSRSMAYRGSARHEDGGRVPAKMDYAKVLAASLSYLLLSQSDSLGLGVFSSALDSFLPPRARQTHFHEAAGILAGIEVSGETDIGEAIAGLQASIKGRAMIIVVSDLLDDPETTLKSLRLLRHRRHELVVFHVLDPDEIEFPFERLSLFKDMEGPDRLVVDPKTIQQEYVRHFRDFMERVRNECRGRGIDYLLARTDKSLIGTISSWLAVRRAAARSGGRR